MRLEIGLKRRRPDVAFLREHIGQLDVLALLDASQPLVREAVRVRLLLRRDRHVYLLFQALLLVDRAAGPASFDRRVTHQVAVTWLRNTPRIAMSRTTSRVA